MEELNMLKLFDNATRSQIFWNLIVYKELSAGELAKMLTKNISTITRNLDIMNVSNLIQVSKINSKKNLQIKYWRINPEIFREPAIVDMDTINELSPRKKTEVMIQLKNFIFLSQNIIHNIISQNIEEVNEDLDLAMFLLDKKTGKLFDQKLKEFISNFFTNNNLKPIKLKNLGLDNYIYFIVGSQIKNSVKSKD